MNVKASGYRKDIDGIRGIAVLMVVAFHTIPSYVPGGFAGVDVFFVLSGYLISSIIFRDISNDRFSIAQFYARRVKRIFPALAVVLFAVLAIGWVFLFDSEFRNLGKHVFGGTTFISNLLLWRETGYFNSDAELKPLLHLWSLGIEEQFYIFFPIGIWILGRTRPSAMTPAVASVLVISILLCVYGTQTRPVATFYLPVTRIWEILLGCFLASINWENARRGDKTVATSTDRSMSMPESSTILNFVSILGITSIAATAFLINSRSPFPGTLALLPTVGTVMIIGAGSNSCVNRTLLCNKLLVGIGLISYPLYLWHWPVLVFARILLDENLTALAISIAVGISLSLSCVTYLFIERPVRFSNILGNKTVVVLCLFIMLLSLSGILAMTNSLPSRLARDPLAQEFDVAVNDWDFPFEDNFQLSNSFGIVSAGLETVASNAAGVLFIGDSHMQQYWPRVEFIRDELQEHSRPIYFVTAGGSPTLPNVNSVAPGYSCDRFYEFCMQEASKPEIGTVVFCCYWEGNFPSKGGKELPGGLYLVGDPQKTPLTVSDAAAKGVFAEFGEDVGQLVKLGKEVFVILSGPSSPRWSPLRNSRFPLNSSLVDRLPVSKEAIAGLVGPIEEQITEVVVANGGQVINPRTSMEEDDLFYGRTVDGKYRYKDDHHMRPFYVKKTATFLDNLIRSP